MLAALGSLRHRPSWPGLDEVIETARPFTPVERTRCAIRRLPRFARGMGGPARGAWPALVIKVPPPLVFYGMVMLEALRPVYQAV